MSKDTVTNSPKDAQTANRMDSGESSKSSEKTKSQKGVDIKNKNQFINDENLNPAEQDATSKWQSDVETGPESDNIPDGDPGADVIETIQEENSKLREQLMRLAAEMDNLRKRTEKEKSNTAKYAISNFARDILSVGDNIRRAIEAVPENVEGADIALKTLIEGVEMTEKELLSVLDRHGIKQITPQGEPFDPNQHQAVFEDTNPEIAAGLCSTIVQPGYVIEDRILRPAMVGVSKGGAKVPRADSKKTETLHLPGKDRVSEPKRETGIANDDTAHSEAQGGSRRTADQKGAGSTQASSKAFDSEPSVQESVRTQSQSETGGRVGAKLDKNA